MVTIFQVFKEDFTHYPARDGKAARDVYSLLLIDMSQPSTHRLSDIYPYALTDDEKEKYWGKADGKSVEVAVTGFANGKVKPYMRGKILAFHGVK